MSVWGKLFTAVRGGANEAAENVADKQALRILDQEIRDAETSLKKARSDLAGIMASNKRLARNIEEARQKEQRDTESARSSIQAGREDLARGLANRIAETRQEIHRDEGELERMKASESQMKRAIQDTEHRLQQMRREVENVKANESLIKAQSAIAHSQSGVNSKLGNAMDSLDRIRKRQDETRGRIEAGEELAALESGSDLDRQLAEAGIGGKGSSSADDVLAQIMGDSKPSIGQSKDPLAIDRKDD